MNEELKRMMLAWEVAPKEDLETFFAHASATVLEYLYEAWNKSRAIDYYQGVIDIALYYIRGQKI